MFLAYLLKADGVEVSWYGTIAQYALLEASEGYFQLRFEHHLAIWLLVGSGELGANVNEQLFNGRMMWTDFSEKLVSGYSLMRR